MRAVVAIALLLALALGCATKVELTEVDYFAIAVYSRNYDEAQRLLARGVDPNGFLADGATPLFVAAHKTDLATVRFLLENGADPNKPVPHYENRTPIMAAAKESTPEVIHELIRYGANRDHRDRLNESAMTIAARRADTAVLAALSDSRR